MWVVAAARPCRARSRIDEEADRQLHGLAGLAAVCSVKQKHSSLLKKTAACSGNTLKIAVPLTGWSEMLVAR